MSKNRTRSPPQPGDIKRPTWSCSEQVGGRRIGKQEAETSPMSCSLDVPSDAESEPFPVTAKPQSGKHRDYKPCGTTLPPGDKRRSMLGPVVSTQPAAKCHPPVNTSQIKVMQGPQTPGKVPAVASCWQALGQFPCVAVAPFQGEAKSPHPTNPLVADLQPALSEATCLHGLQDAPRALVQPWPTGDVSPAPALLLSPSTFAPWHCNANPRAGP